MTRLLGRLLVLGAAAAMADVSIAARGAAALRPAGPAALAFPSTDPALLRLVETLDSAAHVLSAVATDIDQDHDLDLVAATDQAIDVWINDGAGHYTRHRLLPPMLLRTLPGIDEPPSPAGSPGLVSDASKQIAHATRWRVPQPPGLATARPASHAARDRRAVDNPGPGRAPPTLLVLA